MLLAIDTATDRASIALAVSADMPLEHTISGARRHAAELLPAIELLLRRASATLDGVSGIALSDGPGSFTGLRVGAAVAKALVQARGLPLWVAPSLMVRAAGVAQGTGVILAVTYALRAEVYAAAYRFLPDRIVVELAPSVRRPDELVGSDLHPTVVVGDAPPEIVTVLERWSGRVVIPSPAGAPRAAKLFGLIGKSGGATQVDRVHEWEPLYGRPAEAQARWETAHGRPLPDPAGSPR
jgi:tRNA threonylcarbamoyladenosine biosynthesis protein TsaB